MASWMQLSSASEKAAIVIRAPETPAEWEAYWALRYRVLRQPWGAPPGSERDELEAVATHRIALDTATGTVVGCGRIHRRSENTAQIRFMAVEEAYRGCGIGSRLLEELEQWARQQGITTIVLYARSTAIEFYRVHGYHILDKAHTLYGAIEHVLMEKHVA
ncbi:MAG: hypothetical protein KatS3mg039_0024 [Candidatus Kapaibacterium sp.]|nr:MAG: hypothetical protein KatS3mg039_0024 [Candidatus Kapabacteria bacterium]